MILCMLSTQVLFDGLILLTLTSIFNIFFSILLLCRNCYLGCKINFSGSACFHKMENPFLVNINCFTEMLTCPFNIMVHMEESNVSY